MFQAGDTLVAHCNLWCDYVNTQFDPAHLLSELGFTIVFEVVQIVLIAWLWKKIIKPRLIKDVHQQFDTEHGVEHHEDHIHFKQEELSK